LENYAKTTDLYEATFYYLNSCTLVEITGERVNGKITCELTFSKPNVSQLQLTYLQGKATVNIFNFRRAYGQIAAWVAKAKKEFKSKPSIQGGGQ